MISSRVFLCHRNRLLSDCLALALGNSAELQCTVLDPSDPLAELGRIAPGAVGDLLLIDPTLDVDRQSPLPLVRRVKDSYPRLKLALLVPSGAVSRLVEFGHLQNHGCISDAMPLSEVRNAVLSMLGGEPYCSPFLAQALLSQLGRSSDLFSRRQPSQEIRLTVREREILRLIEAEQLSNKQIARRLHVSLYTVKNHVHNIIEKLGVDDRHEAARLAQRQESVAAG